MNREVGLGSHSCPILPPSLISHTVSVDVKFRAQELCESRGGRPGAFRPNEPYGFRGRKAILNRAQALVSACP